MIILLHLAGCSVHFGRDRQQGRGRHAAHGGSKHARGQEGGAEARRVLCGGRSGLRHVASRVKLQHSMRQKLNHCNRHSSFTTPKKPNPDMFDCGLLSRNVQTQRFDTLFIFTFHVFLSSGILNRTDLDSLVKNFVPALIDPVLGDYVRNVANARDAEVLSLFATIINKIGGRCVCMFAARAVDSLPLT